MTNDAGIMLIESKQRPPMFSQALVMHVKIGKKVFYKLEPELIIKFSFIMYFEVQQNLSFLFRIRSLFQVDALYKVMGHIFRYCYKYFGHPSSKLTKY